MAWMAWLRTAEGIGIVALGLFFLIPFLGTVSIGDANSLAEHFAAMAITFLVGAIMIGVGVRELEASSARSAFVVMLIAGALLVLSGGFRASASGYRLWRRPDIWYFHGGDALYWLVHVGFGVCLWLRALTRSRGEEG